MKALILGGLIYELVRGLSKFFFNDPRCRTKATPDEKEKIFFQSGVTKSSPYLRIDERHFAPLDKNKKLPTEGCF